MVGPLLRGDAEQALESFASGEELAAQMGMRPMVLQLRGEAARVLASTGRNGEADEKRADARAAIEEMAALFKDDGLRSRFVESATAKVG